MGQIQESCPRLTTDCCGEESRSSGEKGGAEESGGPGQKDSTGEGGGQEGSCSSQEGSWTREEVFSRQSPAGHRACRIDRNPGIRIPS